MQKCAEMPLSLLHKFGRENIFDSNLCTVREGNIVSMHFDSKSPVIGQWFDMCQHQPITNRKNKGRAVMGPISSGKPSTAVVS